jgi:transposase
MTYREVTMIETKEILRLWLAGTPKKTIARQLSVDPKTVRRYVRAAEGVGLAAAPGVVLSDDDVGKVLLVLRTPAAREHGKSWERCATWRAFIEEHLKRRIRLTKVRKLLLRNGIDVPYATLHRYAIAELGFGRHAPTMPVLDCGPGEEVQLDTGWVGKIEPDLFGKHRRFRAWIFTAVFSRHRFVWPCFQETTESAIEACEEAWAFFGGVFRVLIPDNTKAIVIGADPLGARITTAFREYAQARGFAIDPTRVRSPQDKGRVERAVPGVRDDCFAGEHLQDLAMARALARRWCEEEYGMRRHSRTQRLPREHFEAEERSHLLPAPREPYDVPAWSDPKVGRDQLAQVAKALYSLPTVHVGHKLTARADRALVRFYARGVLVKTHLRQPPGGRSIDPADYPPERTPYALRDLEFLKRKAAAEGEAIGRFAAALLDDPLPWTRMRRVYALLGLVRRYGPARVEDACTTALAHDLLDVRRLGRMLEQGNRSSSASDPQSAPKVIPLARYLRPASQYAIPRHSEPHHDEGVDQ